MNLYFSISSSSCDNFILQIPMIKLSHIARAQHHCLCSNGREEAALGFPTHPHLPSHFPALVAIYDTRDITGLVKLSKMPYLK